MPSDNESSTKSNPKLVSNGQLQGSEKKETRLKQILESKRLNRQNKESSENTGAKSDLRAQLDAQYPEPPSPSKSVSFDSDWKCYPNESLFDFDEIKTDF